MEVTTVTKVSKNIKKVRTAKKLTQDDVAKNLFVTRQTVSSWESGRTQPDIEMLCKLSEFFCVPVEDLIYGEKRFSSEAEKAQNSKRMLIIIFSIIASALMGSGLILIFVNYWENFPVGIKTVFSFVPMLVAQAAAVYTFIKHRDSIAWREGTSVIWCAGMAATVALIDSVFLLPSDFWDCFLIDALLFLPVIYILDVITPFTLYFASTIAYTIYTLTNIYYYDYTIRIIMAVLSVFFFAAGFIYVMLNRKKKDDWRHIFTLWISVIAGFAFILIDILSFDLEFPVVISAATAFFLCIYIADKNDSWILPYKPLGLLGTTAVSVTSVFIMHPDNMYSPYEGYSISERICFDVISFICIAAVVLTGIFLRKTFAKNIMKTIYCSCAAVFLLAELICCVFFPEENHIIVYALIEISALAMAVSLIAEGVTANKFTTLNTGLIATAVLIIYIIHSLVEISMLGAGILLVLFGSVLFAVNYLLARKIKNLKKEENTDA